MLSEVFALQEAIEIMVASTAMALAKEGESKKGKERPSETKWAKWKRGGIIGAAAVTGGALMAITGGMVPQICFAEKFTLETLFLWL